MSPRIEHADGSKAAQVVTSSKEMSGAARSRISQQNSGSEFESPKTTTEGSSAGRVRLLEQIQAQIPADAALIAWLDPPGARNVACRAGEHWVCVVRRRGEPAWVRIQGSGPAGEWTTDDDLRPSELGELIARRPDAGAARCHAAAAAALARQWLRPVEQHLSSAGGLPAVTHLIVIPSEAMAGVPIEALVSSRGEGRPEYTVSYTPSALIFAWLREHRRTRTAAGGKSGSPRLLAVGDPNFKSRGDSERPDRSSSSFEREIPSPHRSEPLHSLPGSRREILAIADLFDRAETLLGSDASEKRLDELARSLELREFDFIHLATHGRLDRDNDRRSSVLLARDRLNHPLEQILAGQVVYDGELSAEQVLRTWTLDAELVTLSACFSGAGRLSMAGSDLAFSHALILKGARSVVLSLWKVDDAATALFMKRFYQNLLGRREGLSRSLPKALALAEAKTWLMTRTAVEIDQLCESLPVVERHDRVAGPPRSAARLAHPYEHPYYWAAFILIGDPD